MTPTQPTEEQQPALRQGGDGMSDLKNCPWCDKAPETMRGQVLAFARCYPCRTSWRSFNEWNTRADAAELAAVRAERDALVLLEWDHTSAIQFDHTIHTGIGFDWFGWENLRQEASGVSGSYAVWKDLGQKLPWSAYDTRDGGLAMWQYATEEEAKMAVEKWERSAITALRDRAERAESDAAASKRRCGELEKLLQTICFFHLRSFRQELQNEAARLISPYPAAVTAEESK